jgi:hypothetical protein
MVERFPLRPFGLSQRLLWIASTVPGGFVFAVIFAESSGWRLVVMFLAGALITGSIAAISARFSWYAALRDGEIRVNLGRSPDLRIPYAAIERLFWDERDVVLRYRAEAFFGDKIVTRTLKLHIENPQPFVDRLTFRIQQDELKGAGEPSASWTRKLPAILVGSLALLALAVIVLSLLG